MLDSKEFGQYLKGLRKARKLTIRQLEDVSGVSNSYISQIEKGTKPIPSPEILRKLADPLGVPYDELMYRAGYISKKDISQLVDVGTHFATKARENSLVTDSFINSFEKEMVRAIELSNLIGDKDLSETERLLLVDEMQGTLDNTIYSINKIKQRIEKSMDRARNEIKNDSANIDTSEGKIITDKISRDILDYGYVKMMEKAGYIKLPKVNKNSEENFDWWGFQLDLIIPAISVDKTRFKPVIEGEIDDFIFENAPHLRGSIEITPDGIRDFVKNHQKDNDEFIKNLINAMLPMSYRFKALAFDSPGSNNNLSIEIDEWLLNGNVTYKKQPLSKDDKEFILEFLKRSFPDHQ